MNLLCLSDFNQDGLMARRGEVCWFMPNVAHRLLDSWPACWARVEIGNTVGPVNVAADMEQVAAAIEAPPVDKMMRKGKRKGA